MAMLRALTAICPEPSLSLYVAHFNHRLRGQDSERDQAFVEDICHRLGVKCIVGRAGSDTPPLDCKDGLEAAARAARYPFFQSTAESIGARYVATAHTAEDQVETILHRIVRGTGIGGLAGMSRARKLGRAVTLIRPFLGFSHRELIGYLADIGQTYREDASNADTDLTRNFIRRELLPLLADRFNPAVGEALLRLGSLAEELQVIVGKLVERLYEETVARETDGRTVRIDAARLAGEPTYLIRELLMEVWRRVGWPMQSMGFAEWTDLAETITCAASAPPRSGELKGRTFPGNVAATAEPGALWLCR